MFYFYLAFTSSEKNRKSLVSYLGIYQPTCNLSGSTVTLIMSRRVYIIDLSSSSHEYSDALWFF